MGPREEVTLPRRTALKKKTDDPAQAPTGIQGAKLEPIRTVERELTRPDGTKVKVRVPVYPPFRLEEKKTAKRQPLERKKAS
jgi:hypothetical protein